MILTIVTIIGNSKIEVKGNVSTVRLPRRHTSVARSVDVGRLRNLRTTIRTEQGPSKRTVQVLELLKSFRVLQSFERQKTKIT